MDAGFYEDLAGRLYGLLIRLEDRLNCDDASVVHQFIDTGHYGLALDLASAVGWLPSLRSGVNGQAGWWQVLLRRKIHRYMH